MFVGAFLGALEGGARAAGALLEGFGGGRTGFCALALGVGRTGFLTLGLGAGRTGFRAGVDIVGGLFFGGGSSLSCTIVVPGKGQFKEYAKRGYCYVVAEVERGCGPEQKRVVLPSSNWMAVLFSRGAPGSVMTSDLIKGHMQGDLSVYLSVEKHPGGDR
jgi:hypothetical protein